MNAVPVKAPLFEQAAIPKAENYAISFATRGLDPCLTRMISCWVHNIPWHLSEEVLQLQIQFEIFGWTLHCLLLT